MRIPHRVRGIELPQFDRLNETAAAWQALGHDVISLGQALPGFEPPPEARDALRRALADTTSHIYSADAGVPELRRALAVSMAALGGVVDPEGEIIITAGGNQAFQLALTTLVDPGEEVVLVSPYFLNHDMAVRSVGAVPVEAPVPESRAFTPTWDDIERALTAKTVAVVLVSPSNPTGAVVSSGELARIVCECRSRRLIVLVDETYLRFTYDSSPATALAIAGWQDTVVVIGSFSKSFAITGWRCGYLVANREVIGEALKIQDCMVICAPVPVQRAVAAALETASDYPARWLPELRERRDLVVELLGRMPGVFPVAPAGGFFVMARFDGMRDSRAGALALIESQQVVTIPGIFFGRAGEGYLRLSYGAVTRDRLITACGRIEVFNRHR